MKSKRPKYISQKQFKAYKKEMINIMKDLHNVRPVIIDPDPYFFDRLKQEFYKRISEIEMKLYKQKFTSEYDEPTL